MVIMKIVGVENGEKITPVPVVGEYIEDITQEEGTLRLTSTPYRDRAKKFYSSAEAHKHKNQPDGEPVKDGEKPHRPLKALKIEVEEAG